MNDVINAISGVGFPIVCCYFMWIFITNTMAEFNKIVNENTKMLSKLCDRLDVKEKEGVEDVNDN